MLKDHVKVLKVFSEAGEVIGRKKLQKMIYIAKKLNFPFYERYDFHFYGPYSEELTLRVEELCNLGFVEEVKEKKGGYNQYRYLLTEIGEQFLAQSETDLPPFNGCMVEMNDQSSRFLELVSTVLYFEGLDKEEVKEKVFTLKSKQRYTEEEIEEAYQYIEKLRNKVTH
ncbi:YwgA family protein [Bacillus salitolerans]|uniref:YwgA family protein n=1 Tax=Bacillus salitolerans TaxID=1437434 RepID=A0ABW4LMC9_9BACI